jgi:ankyrin repeat protein
MKAGADVHAVCNRQRTALHWAAVNNRAAMVQLLLAAGASAVALCNDGLLALHAACHHGPSCSLQIIKQLVSSGGPGLIEFFSQLVSSSLLTVVSGGCNTEVAAFLVSNGADVTGAHSAGIPLLVFAKEAAMVQLLLDAGAAVNARDMIGSTVLHQAAHVGYSTGMLRCLLKAGADATATDTTGSTPAAVALAYGHTAAATLLQRAEADQRSKQQQRAEPLSADRQILNGWQSSKDMTQRRGFLMTIWPYLTPAKGMCSSADMLQLQHVEFELVSQSCKRSSIQRRVYTAAQAR